MTLKDKLLMVANYVRMKVEHENKKDNPKLYGTCVDASLEIKDMLEDIGIDAEFIEGWVSYDISSNCSDRSYDEHCWVEVKENDATWYVDVTATQFNAFVCNEFEPVIVSTVKPNQMLYYDPSIDDEP